MERLKRTQKEQGTLADCIRLAKALFDERLEDALSVLHRQFWIVRTWIDASVENIGADREFSVEIRREIASTDAEKSKVARAIQESLRSADEI